MNCFDGIVGSSRDFMREGRSIAHGTHGMVVTSQPLATATAINILRDGGNAMDAAVAACAVLSLTEPHQTGPGGDCFALMCRNGRGPIIGYNGSGRAPAAIDRADLPRGQSAKWRYDDANAVTIPGAVEAWVRLSQDFGRLPLSRVLAPAIEYAEAGIVVHERVAFDWNVHSERIAQSPYLSERVAPNGAVLKAGRIVRFPEIARTFRAVATYGFDGFYAGPVARSMVKALNEAGGVHTAEDFLSHRGEYVAPLSADYRGFTVHECPPNGQGVVALTILGLLERIAPDPEGPQGRWRYHSLVEAARIAFAARDHFLCDPASRNGDMNSFTEPSFLDAAAKTIRSGERIPDHTLLEMPEHRDTVYLAVVDRDRNAVSLINSVFEPFGSTICDAESGVIFHNRGIGFSLDPDHPNAVAPGKRPMHTIIPGMLTYRGNVVMAFGVMGGDFQPVGHAQFLSGLFDYGLDLQSAMNAPRLFPSKGTVWIERGIGEHVREHLLELGYSLSDRIEPAGGAQAIWIDPDSGVLSGASDCRKDGCALGF